MLDTSSERQAAEAFLGTTLPDDATHIHFLYFKPDKDQHVYSAFLKIECSSESYSEFSRRLNLKTNADQLTPHLPAA
jgi:hypothetical protein